MKHLGVVLVLAILLTTLGAIPAAAAPAAAPSLASCGATYTVRWGDTLADIAWRCGTSVGALLDANPSVHSANRIWPGMKLSMPGAKPMCRFIHVVKWGDTVGNIAAHYGISSAALLRANRSIGNPNRIFSGMRLCIPGAPGKPPADDGAPVFKTVKVALIAIGEGNIGCQDAVQLVNVSVSPTTAPLTASMEKLVGVQGEFYGQSGLYNALHLSNLKVQKVTLENGLAKVWLTGTFALGGECDDPRVAAQFDATARQFSTVKKVQIYINGKPLESMLGGKGQ